MTEASEVDVICQCIALVTDGPTFEDWEFQTLFGRTRDEVRAVGASLSSGGSKTRDMVVAVSNVLVNLRGYPGGERDWAKWVLVPSSLAFATLEHWLNENYIAG